jgi:tetratricopeptide (TPR) repeat protein
MLSFTRQIVGYLTALFCLAASLGTTHQIGAAQPATPQGEKTIVDNAIALWKKGDCEAALADFRKSIEADAGNLALHARFAKAAFGDPRAFRRTDAATKALANLRGLYARWMTENPARAVYPYAAALLLDRAQAAKKEQLLLKAAALDRRIVEPYVELVNLNSGYDNALALTYAKKALEIKPADIPLQIMYARVLWAVDQTAARRYYDGLLKRTAGTKDGAVALQQFIVTIDDPAEAGTLVERFRHDFPNQWTPSLFANISLFAWYFTRQPDKGLAFAREMLAAADKPQPTGVRSPTELLTLSGGEFKRIWQEITNYAQAIVDAQSLIREKKGAEALARLEKVTTPRTVDDLPQLTLVRAEAVAVSGDVPKAYEMLAAELERDAIVEYQQAVIMYGKILGKSARQVDAELWTRQLAKAEPFKDFDLSKLGSGEHVKLSDLRGKVVLVDFWFPG